MIRPPRAVPRGFFDMGSRSNAYEALMHACWWVGFCGSYRRRPPGQALNRVRDALRDIDALLPQVDGPRSIRVGARRAATRARRIAARLLRALEAA